MTGTVAEPALEEIVIEALYVPAAKLPALTETPIELGVVPLVLLSESHDAVDFESVKLIAEPVLLVTDSVWEAGDVPPC